MERREQIMAWLKQVLDKNLSGLAFNAFIFGSQQSLILLNKRPSHLEIDGAIQRFEYCFDLSWKTLKRHLETTG